MRTVHLYDPKSIHATICNDRETYEDVTKVPESVTCENCLRKMVRIDPASGTSSSVCGVVFKRGKSLSIPKQS